MFSSSIVLNVLNSSFLAQVRMKALLFTIFLGLGANASKIVELPQSNDVIAKLDQQIELKLPFKSL